ncbi:MAG: ABC transporter permease [Verrucomicrobiales bacterium]|nr:ABC transporter permease [Verrucomicrobiales bacterium]
MNDLKFAFRQLLKNPGFTTVAVLTLALGIGANTAIFSLFNAVVLRPPNVRDVDRLARLHLRFAGQVERRIAGNRRHFSYEEYLMLRDRSQSFSGVTAYTSSELTLGETEPERVEGLIVSGEYFRVIGADAFVGRLLSSADCVTPGAHPVAVLSHAFWIRQFGADTNLLGKTISLNSHRFTVVGVTAPGFVGLDLTPPDIWIPLMMQAQVNPKRDFLATRNVSWLQVVTRLKPTVSSKQAETEMGVLAQQFDSEFPGRRTTIHVMPGTSLHPALRGKVIALASLVMAAVGAVLLIACVNVANMLLARAAARQTEIGIRLALGAARSRLVRQLLTEGLLLALLGGTVGLLVGSWVSEFLWAAVLPFHAQAPTLRPGPDLRVFVFSGGISFVAAVLSGLVPALQATTLDVTSILKGDTSAFGRRLSRSRLRNALVIGQLALSFILLSGAGLLVKTLLVSYIVGPGFTTRDVAVLSFDWENSGYSDARAAQFHQQLQERLSGLPGVRMIALTANLPLSGVSSRMQIFRDRADTRADTPKHESHVSAVSPGYFQTLGMQLMRGRHFTEADARAAAPVAIISEAVAQRLWPGDNPLGKRFREGDSADPLEVIGVTHNVRSVNLAEPDGPLIYRPMNPANGRGALVLLRTDNGVVAVMSAVRQLVRELDPNLSVTIRSLEQNLERARRTWQQGALLSCAIGVLAVLLASVGLYGVMAYTVSQRTREVGIRMALGARPADILRLVIRQGAKTVSLGLAIGLVFAFVISRFLSNRFFGMDAAAPVAFLAISALLAGLALVACYIPARRAAKVDPMVALRYE